jgi:(4S)-4-hydroxy-5-phosphonooxypentane-2,3-dione isomerase
MTANPSPPLTPDPQFAIIVTFDIRADAYDRFVELVCANAAESVRSEPDCLRFDVMTPSAPQARICLYEIYTDRRAFEHHLATPHFLSFDRATRDMVTAKTVTDFSLVASAG